MSTYRLDRLLAARSIALVGASLRENSVGRKILRNLKTAGFDGSIQLVNPNHTEIEGVSAVSNVAKLSPVPDLLIIAVPPASILKVVSAAAAVGCPAAIVITSGLGQGDGSLSKSIEQVAGAHGMRLLGPNCLGLQVPGIKLNASFAAHMCRPGDLALISQSGAIAAGLIE